MLEHKCVKYNITDEPNLNGKGRMFMYSINFEPLKKIKRFYFSGS